jgi:hypothetical protein|tara:strand:- start:681 stop:947 length:267 start_codon:yes stop_codon:yes gene_type:complete
MTQQQLIELVRTHHPEMTEAEVRIRLTSAMKDFCTKTRIIKAAFQFTTVPDQRLYGLNDKVIEIDSVDYDGKTIKRLVGRPEARDVDG